MTTKECLEKYYIIKDNGVVLRKKDLTEVKFCKDNKGYLKARIHCPEISKHKDKRKTFRLHRLVAMFYLKDYSEKLQVNHLDMNKENNNVSNLEMVTNSQNVQHAWDYDKENGCERRKKISKCLKGKFKKK